VLLASCAVARAQLPSQIEVRWQTSAACSKTANFEADLARRLGPDAERAQPLRIEVEIAALAEAGYQLTLVAEGSAEARRSLQVASCEEAERAAAVLIATAVVPAAASAESAEAAPSARAPSRRPPWSLRIGLLGDLAALPGPSGGPSVGVGYDFPRPKLWLDARYGIARESNHSAEARSEIDLFALALGGAYAWQLGPVWLGPALELELGALRGRAAGAREAGSRAAPWIAAFAGALLGADLGRVTLTVSTALGVPLLRPEFQLEGQTNVYETSAITGRAQLGVSVPLGDLKKTPASGQ
jgi:hypothetical protein